MGSTIDRYNYGEDVAKSSTNYTVKYERPELFTKIINSSFDTIRFDNECYGEDEDPYFRNRFIDQVLTSIGPDLYELYIRSNRETYCFTGGIKGRLLGRTYSSRQEAVNTYMIGRSINMLLDDVSNFEYTLGLSGNTVLVDLQQMSFERYISKVLRGNDAALSVKKIYDHTLRALHYLIFNLDISHYSLTLDKISIIEGDKDTIPIIKDFSSAHKGSFFAYDAYSLLRSLVETTEWFDWYGDKLKLFYDDITLGGIIPKYFVGDREYSIEDYDIEIHHRSDDSKKKIYVKYLEGDSSMLTILHLPQIRLFSPSYSKFEKMFNYGRSIRITMEYIALLDRLNINSDSRVLTLKGLINGSSLEYRITKNVDGYTVLGKTELLQIVDKGVISLKDSITLHEPNRYRPLVEMKNPTNEDIDTWIMDPWIRINLFMANIETNKGDMIYMSPYINDYTSYISNKLVLIYYENLKGASITGKLSELIRASIGGLVMSKSDANFAVGSVLPNSCIDKMPAYGNCYFCALAKHINKNQSSVREDIAIYLERLRDVNPEEYIEMIRSFLNECPSEKGNYKDRFERSLREHPHSEKDVPYDESVPYRRRDEEKHHERDVTFERKSDKGPSVDRSFLSMFPDYVRLTCRYEYTDVDCRDCIYGGDVYDKIISIIYDIPVVSVSVGFLIRYQNELIIENELVKVIAKEAGILTHGDKIPVEDNRLTILFRISAPYNTDNYKGQIIPYLFNIKHGHIDFIEL